MTETLSTICAHLQSSIPVTDTLLQFLQHGIHGCRALLQALLALQKLPGLLEITHTFLSTTDSTETSLTPKSSTGQSGITSSTQAFRLKGGSPSTCQGSPGTAVG